MLNDDDDEEICCPVCTYALEPGVKNFFTIFLSSS